jgi:septum formation protein
MSATGPRRAQRELVLASGSPRRREILSQLGIAFRIEESGVDEPPHRQGTPESYARALSALKAEAVAQRISAGASHDKPFVLGADTIVVIGEQVLGKPDSDAHASEMLRALSGQMHEVITAVSLRRAGTGDHWDLAQSTRVWIAALDAQAIAAYVASGEGRDKAGSYAIQGLGAGLVKAVEGSYTNVVGLPASETLELLRKARVIERWP